MELPVKTKQGGFTLIELMIVVAIIGILASLSITIYDSYAIKSRISEESNALGTAMNAAQQYHSYTGTWPASMTAANLYEMCMNTFGVTLPTTYVQANAYTAPGWVDGATELTIQAQLNATGAGVKQVGRAVNGLTLTLTSGADGGQRTWDGSIPIRYKPKN